MDQCNRVNSPLAGNEKTMLGAFLDWQRATLLCKLEGLDHEQLRRVATPSGVCLLGIVKHQTLVERSWFGECFAGEPLDFPWSEEDPNSDWRIEPDETTAGILDGYRRAVERSRAIVAQANLDDRAAYTRESLRGVTLRWIVLHMVEEVARHVGHADLLREAIDGQTGE